MLAPDQNLYRLYREIAVVESEMTEAARRSAALEAEISPECAADWYLVQTFPGDDLRGMRWLARRRFGVFRPMTQRIDRQRGIHVQGWEPVFPGWLFVYCWDVGKMRARIEACPGIMSILCDPVSQSPVAVNTPDKEGIGFVDRLRALGWVYNENAPRLTRHAPMRRAPSNPQPKRIVRRPTSKERKQLDALKNQFRTMGLEWDAEAWAHANRLDPYHRIALMRRTIGQMLPDVG